MSLFVVFYGHFRIVYNCIYQTWHYFRRFFNKNIIMAVLQENDLRVVCNALRDFEPDKKLNRAVIAFHKSLATYIYDISENSALQGTQGEIKRLPGLALIHIHMILAERRRDLHLSIIRTQSPNQLDKISNKIITITKTLKNIETLGKSACLENKDYQTYSKNIITPR